MSAGLYSQNQTLLYIELKISTKIVSDYEIYFRQLWQGLVKLRPRFKLVPESAIVH